jgi:Uma2 family endonuclease
MATAAARVLFDPNVEATYDPFEEDMGESTVQRFLSEELRPEIQRLLDARGEPAFVGADQYIGWDPHDARKVVAPDVYVLPGVEAREQFDFWKVWQTGVVPSFALEIVSTRKGKDYVDAPMRYADLGVKELVVFDPQHKRRRGGLRWQVYRPLRVRGFVRVEATNEDRVRSRVLGGWLRAVGTGKRLAVRLAADPRGEELIPTAAEDALASVDAERARADAALARVDAERARADAAEAQANLERAARERLEAALAEARAQLAASAAPKRRR